jgi:hypothetical protein
MGVLRERIPYIIGRAPTTRFELQTITKAREERKS